jgi:predicted kinase
MKELYLLRGLPGSGKSTLAKSLNGFHVEADMFFMKEGEYLFDGSKLKDAHEWCQNEVNMAMILNHTTGVNNRIIVSNTFTQEWEMKAYLDLAKSYNYTVFSLIVENRHGGVNEHGVPEEALDRMRNRFEIKL